VLTARDAGGAPCHRVYELAQAKLEGITADIAALRQTERYLRDVLADWEMRMRQAGPGKKAHLLHSLTDVLKNSPAMPNKLRRRKA
jgi:hypothetical protein